MLSMSALPPISDVSIEKYQFDLAKVEEGSEPS
jgi:hypothetical protein